jgi:hypothetical protein
VTERTEHLEERHMSEQAGDDRRDRDHQQRIEPQREAEDDERDPEQREIVHGRSSLRGGPNPPPPGVSITNRSPGATSADSVTLSISIIPSPALDPVAAG